MNKDVFRTLRQMLMEELDLSRELSDKEILDVIDELILNQMKDVRLALKEKVQLRQELFYSVRKLDVLQELVDDETVTEIMVNGPDTIFVERDGRLIRWHKSFTSAEKLEDVIQQIVGKCNRVINESMPIVDARLENGSRVNAVIYPVALNGPILTIRRFPEHPITMEKLIALGSITKECADFLQKLVKARYSMVIGGGTGSGKTTFLAAMSEYIPKDERLITIEDNAELRIRGIDNLVRLEAKMANMEGAVSVTIRDLIKSALRMRPDRIIVGEVRGGEAMDMLQALNTGHEGSKNWKERGLNYERERKRTALSETGLWSLSFYGEGIYEIYRTGSGTLCCGRLSFLQKCLGTASYASGVSILSEMAAEPYDQGKKKEAELPV